MTAKSSYVADLERQVKWAQNATRSAESRNTDYPTFRGNIRDLHAQGAPQALLARATGLTRQRISQIVA